MNPIIFWKPPGSQSLTCRKYAELAGDWCTSTGADLSVKHACAAEAGLDRRGRGVGAQGGTEKCERRRYWFHIPKCSRPDLGCEIMAREVTGIVCVCLCIALASAQSPALTSNAATKEVTIASVTTTIEVTEATTFATTQTPTTSSTETTTVLSTTGSTATTTAPPTTGSTATTTAPPTTGSTATTTVPPTTGSTVAATVPPTANSTVTTTILPTANSTAATTILPTANSTAATIILPTANSTAATTVSSTSNSTETTVERSTSNVTQAANSTSVSSAPGNTTTVLTTVFLMENSATAIMNGTVLTPKRLQLDPGLIIIIVILVLILLIAVIITAVKYSQNGKPGFKRLQEMPMNSLNEEVPFAQYPPK
ncbi:uncharacterized protein LOC132406585 [Hypanus sabinus]|uniref:uncharacterized protein LOC132406585 n=1 Tax=Hypanus sabinus TaxID=79690 RepID=UPI0028C4F164|nr:uncharacterized protein LOC132406585 [Hypanus sabinus]